MAKIIVSPQIVPPAELEMREWHGQRVVTLADIDRLHRRPEGTAGRNFRENRNRFIVGEDYFELDHIEITEFGWERPQGGVPNRLILLTESGYRLTVKSFKDDLAWQVQRNLSNAYFRGRAVAIKPVALLYLADAIRATKKALPPGTDMLPFVRAAYEAAGIVMPDVVPMPPHESD